MIRLLWEKLKSTIWFIPTLIAAVLVFTAFGLVTLDLHTESYSWEWVSKVKIGSSGVRQVLAVTSSAMISITGVIFSISIVALTLAANQLGPKVLRNYLRDSKNKMMLGLMVGSFLFGLVVLTSIDGDSSRDIPVFAFLASMIIVVTAVAGFVYFIHNISTSIQADHAISLIGIELNQLIDKKFPPLANEQQNSEQPKREWKQITHPHSTLSIETIFAQEDGYVEFISIPRMMNIAQSEKVFLEVLIRPGDFIIAGTQIINIYSNDKISTSCKTSLYSSVSFGRQRTPVDDVEYAIVQLMQIALRALSPGVNDSLTAISCINWLTASLGRMIKKDSPIEFFKDDNDSVRLKKREFDFTDATNAIFKPLRENSRTNEMVMIRLLECIAQLMPLSKKTLYSDILLHHAQLMLDEVKGNFPCQSDIQDAMQRFKKCQQAHQRSAEHINQLRQIKNADA